MPAPTTIEGYTAESAYPSLFHQNLSPASLDSGLRRAGFVRPTGRRAFRMLDLGCGDGMGLALMAAAHPEGQFIGIDALEEHAQTGNRFAGALGLGNFELRCQTFEEALGADHGIFDYITCHGVMAWVSAENRGHVLALAQRLLAPGGVLYLGYNSMPGWQNRLTFQRMLLAFSRQATGRPFERFETALAQIRDLQAAGMPAISEDVIAQIEKLRANLPNEYFVHEYLNDHWQPLWASDLHAQASAAGLRFATAQEALAHRPDLRLQKAKRAALENIALELRERAIDCLVNQTFRRDLFLRAEDRPETSSDAVLDTWLAARVGIEDARFEAQTPAGKIRFDNPAARAVIAALRDAPRSLRDLVDTLPFGRGDILNAVDCLWIGADIAPTCPQGPDFPAAERNRKLLEMARNGMRLNGLVGRHGPVECAPLEVLSAAMETDALIARAMQDPDVFSLVFEQGVDLAHPEMREKTEALRLRVLAGFERKGILL